METADFWRKTQEALRRHRVALDEDPNIAALRTFIRLRSETSLQKIRKATTGRRDR